MIIRLKSLEANIDYDPQTRTYFIRVGAKVNGTKASYVYAPLDLNAAEKLADDLKMFVQAAKDLNNE